ncbi:hypothetical protein ACO0K9_02565 [Undibacterium sp. Ji50W]|uniref:hypothetical protein n=1 Tax=Undibacterium sp. Ji50W TaxID=3413041 RepID=UPI003BEFD4DB
MKTTWLSQLKQSMRPTAQGSVSVCALPVTLTINAGVADTAKVIINILNTKLNTLTGNSIDNINRRSKHIISEQSQSASFKAYSILYSRIRRENLQVAGAS